MNGEQKSRIAAYRRQRPTPESLSDTQAGQVETFVGQSHPVPTMAAGGGHQGGSSLTPGGALTPRSSTSRQNSGGPANLGTPKALQNYNVASRGPSPNGNPLPGGGVPFGNGYPPQRGGAAALVGDRGGAGLVNTPNPVTGAGNHLQNVPADLATYILQLEGQNQELRSALSQSQSQSQQQQQQQQQQLTAGGTVGGRLGGASSMLQEYGEDEKRMFLNDVLSQVETVIQAHKNKTAAEIQKYKTEADNATVALRNLRSAVTQEGMDLALAPAMISLQRRGGVNPSGVYSGEAVAKAKAQGLDLALPPESQQLLEGISEEYLTKLLAVRTSNEVPRVVRETTKTSFEAVVLHFTDQLCRNFEESESVVNTLKTEVNSLQQELRTQHQMSESHKVQLVQQGEQECQALRDQLRSFQLASSGGDEIAAAVNERALEEYTHMLIEARRDSNHLRQELETERNHCATVCLRLKTSLQKRNSDFETAVVARAEEVVKQNQAKVSELQAQVAAMDLANDKEFREIAVQAGDPSVTIPSQESFIPNVMSAVKNDPSRRNTPHNKEIFEQEVWRKTQELLHRYGNSNQQ